MKRYETKRQGHHLALTTGGHLEWMADYNADGWDDATWRAFTIRCSTDPAFKRRAQRAKAAGEARPHPTEDGWVPPVGQVGDHLVRSMGGS